MELVTGITSLYPVATTPDLEDLLIEWFGVDPEESAAVAERCAIWLQGDASCDREPQDRFGTLGELALVISLDELSKRRGGVQSLR